MDTSTTPTATTTVKNPEPEPEPLTRIKHTTKPLTFTNGVLKRHHPLHHPHHHLNAPPTVVAYKECLKNHAATLGAHAVDGCGEFMPSPTANPTDPTSLKCAACGCHRNFHRREPEDPLLLPSPTSAQHVIEYQPHHRHHPPPPPPPHGGVGGSGGGGESPNSSSPPPISSSYYPSAPHMLLALSAGGLSAPPPENTQTTTPTTPAVAGASIGSNPNLRKRFRTKFTADQKEKMQKFAERVGWKMQKRDEELISEFCGEVGVEKGVFKVWMHNNKNTFGKQQQTEVINKINGGIIGNTNSPPPHHNSPSSTLYHHNDISNHHQQLQQQKLNKVNDVVVVTNGSSSSS